MFRRNRTLTGSASNTIAVSGESSTHDLKSSRLKVHELKKNRRKLTMFLFTALAVVGGLVWFVALTAISTTVSVVGVSTGTVTTDYKHAIDRYLNDHPMERFTPVLDKKQLLVTLQASHPEISAVDVVTKSPYKPAQFTLRARQPIVLWNIASRQYFIDSTGTSFQRNLFDTPRVVVSDQSGVNYQSAKVAASTRMLRYVGRLTTNISMQGYTVSKIILPPNSLKEVDIEIEGVGYPFKTLADRDPAGQATDLVNALRYFEQKNLAPRYVDVRVSSKAFWQ